MPYGGRGRDKSQTKYTYKRYGDLKTNQGVTKTTSKYRTTNDDRQESIRATQATQRYGYGSQQSEARYTGRPQPQSAQQPWYNRPGGFGEAVGQWASGPDFQTQPATPPGYSPQEIQSMKSEADAIRRQIDALGKVDVWGVGGLGKWAQLQYLQSRIDQIEQMVGGPTGGYGFGESRYNPWSKYAGAGGRTATPPQARYQGRGKPTLPGAVAGATTGASTTASATKGGTWPGYVSMPWLLTAATGQNGQVLGSTGFGPFGPPDPLASGTTAPVNTGGESGGGYGGWGDWGNWGGGGGGGGSYSPYSNAWKQYNPGYASQQPSQLQANPQIRTYGSEPGSRNNYATANQAQRWLQLLTNWRI